MTTAKQMDLKNLDKSAWQSYRFNEIAEKISKTVDPNTTELEIYVGLEHIDAENIHIRRYGKPSDVSGGKLLCFPGDVIFGKRRAYQRKAAIVDFTGICSAHAFVLRAIPEIIDSKLFPFFLHSDEFMHRMVDISVGGLSPTINWGDLKHQEFRLPPLAEQALLAELLWAMDKVIENEKKILDFEKSLKHSHRKRVFMGHDINILKKQSSLPKKSNWKIGRVADFCEIHNNLRKPISKELRLTMAGQFPYHGPTSVLSYISEFRIDGDFVLIGEDGDHFLKYNEWNMTQYVSGKFNVNNHAHLLKGTKQCLTKWIFYSFQHRNIIPHITRQGASRYKLNKEGLSEILLLIPPVKEQQRLISQFDLIEKNLELISGKIASSKALLKSLINQIFSTSA